MKSYSIRKMRQMIRKEAERLGSQAILAAKCGVSNVMICKVMSDQAQPTDKIAAYFGLRREVRFVE